MPSKVKKLIPIEDYILFQRYYQQFGIGEEAEFLRSGTMIATLISLVTGVAGKAINKRPDEIYPQLLQVGATTLDSIPLELKKQMVDAGILKPEAVEELSA